MNIFYDFIIPGPILRHLGEFGKIRSLPKENARFLPEMGHFGYLDISISRKGFKNTKNRKILRNIELYGLKSS